MRDESAAAHQTVWRSAPAKRGGGGWGGLLSDDEGGGRIAGPLRQERRGQLGHSALTCLQSALSPPSLPPHSSAIPVDPQGRSVFSFYLFFLFPGKPVQLHTLVEVATFWRPMKSFSHECDYPRSGSVHGGCASAKWGDVLLGPGTWRRGTVRCRC